MILLDTHIWVRWQNAPETLPPKILSRIAESDALAVSAISCWEVAMLARKNRIELSMPIDEWIEEALAYTDACLSIDRGFCSWRQTSQSITVTQSIESLLQPPLFTKQS